MSYTRRVGLLLSLSAAAALIVTPLAFPTLRRAGTWEALASPGRLSDAHAFLGTDCAACHTPVEGPEAKRCIACHADDETVLSRQPTAFHADVASCRECHAEHEGPGQLRAPMDHATLAKIGLRTLRRDGSSAAERDRLVDWLREVAPEAELPRGVRAEEAALDCSACHATKDRHRGLFGADCVACHRVDSWSLPEFRHPSARSTDCVECHQAPPSHFMGHFKMVSAPVAGQEHASVEQCYLCHQTTSWNDIKGVGWYKHH